MSWYSMSLKVVKISCIIYFMIGFFVFLTGLLQLALAQTVAISVRAGILMMSSFVMMTSNVFGFYGSYDENFCLIVTYGVTKLALFFLRLVTTMVKVRIMYLKKGAPKTDEEFNQIPFLMLTDMVSGLPGAQMIPLQVIYAIFECILCFCCFHIFMTINRSMNQKLKKELMMSNGYTQFGANGQPIIEEPGTDSEDYQRIYGRRSSGDRHSRYQSHQNKENRGLATAYMADDDEDEDEDDDNNKVYQAPVPVNRLAIGAPPGVRPNMMANPRMMATNNQFMRPGGMPQMPNSNIPFNRMNAPSFV